VRALQQSTETTMELRASLNHLNVTTPDPAAMAAFYCSTYGMTQASAGDAIVCTGPGRVVALTRGPANKLAYAHYTFNDTPAWLAFRDRVPGAAQVDVPALARPAPDAVAIKDPDGNVIVFSPPYIASDVEVRADAMPQAILQHFALRTTQPQAMLAFYQSLGFVLSDEVHDPTGAVRACFLRTEHLHHSLALFGAPAAGFDHQSFETDTWADMRVWGDRMAELRVPIVWGIGRHGPGNDVFFMVRDPDGNLAEISAEIEVCESERPAGVWVHEERTLNLWGKAIMRD
jgi:catechol 2,3-dioxygenase-like lactoylglutathione lyase family enzyme